MDKNVFFDKIYELNVELGKVQNLLFSSRIVRNLRKTDKKTSEQSLGKTESFLITSVYTRHQMDNIQIISPAETSLVPGFLQLVKKYFRPSKKM